MSAADFANAAASAGALGEAGALPGAGIGVVPGLGLEKGLNFDFASNGNLGAGLGGLGFPFLGGVGGYGVPYIPSTPLGSYWGFKGDLIGPILVIGFVLFLVIIVILAIKAAFAWKLDLLAAKGSKFVRAAADNIEPEGAQHTEENQLNELAHMVLTAIQSQSCAQKVVCDIGTYARARDGLANLLRILEAMVPSSMIAPLTILRDSAEGKYDCAQKYPCGTDSQKSDDTKSNTVDTSNQKTQNQG